MPPRRKPARSSPYFLRKRGTTTSEYFEAPVAASPESVEPTAVATEPVAGAPCAACGVGTLAERDGRFGPFLGCTQYPTCRNTHKLVGLDGASPPRCRKSAGPRLRLEMEACDTVRVWSTEAQESLGVALGAIDGASIAPARTDWTAANARQRVSAVMPLTDHDALVSRLQRTDGAGSTSTSAGSTDPPTPTFAVTPVPPSTLAFFRGLPGSACEAPVRAYHSAPPTATRSLGRGESPTATAHGGVACLHASTGTLPPHAHAQRSHEHASRPLS